MPGLDTKYKDDRFLLAYQQLVYNGIPTKWTDYTDSLTEELYESVTNKMRVFPNPVTGNLTVIIKEPGVIKIFSSNGQLVGSIEKGLQGENIMSTEGLSKGIYSVKVEYLNGTKDNKGVKGSSGSVVLIDCVEKVCRIDWLWDEFVRAQNHGIIDQRVARQA